MLLSFSFCTIVFRALWLVSLRFSSKPALSAIVFIELFNSLTPIALALNRVFPVGFFFFLI